MNERPEILVIGGYDQSGGAGVLADVKTAEAHKVYAHAVCTALTFQNEWRIERIDWLSEEDIFSQIDLCSQNRSFGWAKIGICRSVSMIDAIMGHLLMRHPGIRVVLDPVIRASSGKDFWESHSGAILVGSSAGGANEKRRAWESVISQAYLLTPNWEEIGWLYPNGEVEANCRRLTSSTSCRLYLKGGHHPEWPGRDYLWSGGEVLVLDPAPGIGEVHQKHGSGCVLASSLTANLALGYPLEAAAVRSKRYIETFLSSNKSLLGWHRQMDQP